ncbi:MAG: hypothetical protein IVW36_04015 [Dehalococcoidia bacterium]|nr:hypothetical protein [Dehalococcoidia bacterium]
MRKVLALSVVVGALLVAFSLFGSNLQGRAATAEAATWQTKTVTWGPYTIPANGEGKNWVTTDNCFGLGGIVLQLLGGATCVNRTVQLPCTNCYIGSITPNLVYANGSAANMDTGPMLHHMVLMSRARSDLSCPKNLFGGPIQQMGALLGGNERIFASGNERTVMDMTAQNYGYQVGSSDKWMLITDLMNMSSTDKTVYLQFTFKYATSGVTPVKPLWLDIDNCQDSELAMGAGYSDTHKDWTSTITGTVVEMGGHGHGEALATAVQNVNTGAYYCTSVAGYHFDSMDFPGPGPGTAGHPATAIAWPDSAPIYSDPRTAGGKDAMDVVESQTVCQPNMAITAGQVMRIHQTYNEMASDPNNMGIMVGFIK